MFCRRHWQELYRQGDCTSRNLISIANEWPGGRKVWNISGLTRASDSVLGLSSCSVQRSWVCTCVAQQLPVMFLWRPRSSFCLRSAPSSWVIPFEVLPSLVSFLWCVYCVKVIWRSEVSSNICSESCIIHFSEYQGFKFILNSSLVSLSILKESLDGTFEPLKVL